MNRRTFANYHDRWLDPPDTPDSEDDEGRPLQYCSKHKRHFYSHDRHDCPWCDAEIDARY